MIRSNVPALPAPDPCPEPLRYILTKAMTPDPGMRYQSASQFAHDLILFRDGREVGATTGDFESTRRTFGRPAPDDATDRSRSCLLCRIISAGNRGSSSHAHGRGSDTHRDVADGRHRSFGIVAAR